MKSEEENPKRRRVEGMEENESLRQNQVDIRHLLASFKQNPDGSIIRVEMNDGGVEEGSGSEKAASELLSQSLNSK